MKVYVAAASAEIERAELVIELLRSLGVVVVSTWPQEIRKVQAERTNGDLKEAGNPTQATVEERRKWALQNTIEIAQSDVFLMLAPSAGVYSHGAYFELAWAVRSKLADMPNLRVVVSGGDQRYVFVALADELHATDEAAIRAVVDYAIKTPTHQTFTEQLLDSLTDAELDKVQERFKSEPYALARINYARERRREEGRFVVDVCTVCGETVNAADHTCSGEAPQVH